MKKLFLAVAMMLTAFGANAQSNWEAKAGVGLSSLAGSDTDADAKFSFKLGVGYNINISEAFSVQPAIMYANKGWKGDETYNLSYIQIPIMAAYKFGLTDNMNMTVNAGPYFAYGISGTNDAFNSDGLDLEKFDCGLGAGVKVDINNFLVGIDMEYGLTKIIKDVKAYNISYGVTLGYKF